MSHYIPVAAKRRALEVYRQRRQDGEPPENLRTLSPTEAMRSTVRFFAGHLAAELAFRSNSARQQELLDGYRAADYYRTRLYEMPWWQWSVNNNSGWADSYTEQRGPDESLAEKDVDMGKYLAEKYGPESGRRVAEAMLAGLERLEEIGSTAD
jgi:hypothetical protein